MTRNIDFETLFVSIALRFILGIIIPLSLFLLFCFGIYVLIMRQEEHTKRELLENFITGTRNFITQNKEAVSILVITMCIASIVAAIVATIRGAI